MDEKHLSKRLARAAAYVRPGDRLADIGSDHAYLPCALVLDHVISFAVAGEVVPGPFQSAKKQVESLNLKENIQVRLGDGLDVVSEEDQLTVITICGMGGHLIASILERATQQKKLNGQERLILQPNVDEYILRKWLVENQYAVTAEEILEEKGKFYEIIVAEKEEALPIAATEKDLTYGFFLKEQQDPIFRKKWEKELKKREQVVENLKKAAIPQSEKIDSFNIQIAEIKELLKK